MKFKEMLRMYPDEWLVIEVKKFHKKTLRVEEGKILFHSPVETEIYDNLMKFKGLNLSIEFAGNAPKDMAVLL